MAEELMTPTTPTAPTNDTGLSTSAPAAESRSLGTAPAEHTAANAPTKPGTESGQIPDAGTNEYPAEFPDFFKDFGKKHKLTADQLKATTEFLNMGLEAAKNTDQTVLAEAGRAHVQTWGQQAQENLAVAKRALKQSDTDGKLTALLRDTGFAHHPVVLEFFKDLGMNLREGGFLKGAINVPPGEKTLAQAMYGENHPSKN